MELLELSQQCLYLVDWRQYCCTKVVSTRQLMESTAGHNTNTRIFQQIETVELIRLHILALENQIQKLIQRKPFRMSLRLTDVQPWRVRSPFPAALFEEMHTWHH
jgi:hypothetical protein